jgi:hypothetical protein
LLLAVGVASQRIPPDLEARSASGRGYLAGQKILLVLDEAAGTERSRRGRLTSGVFDVLTATA